MGFMAINTDEQLVFTPEMIKNSTMSGDNAVLCMNGICPKCRIRSLYGKNSLYGTSFKSCNQCKTVFLLPINIKGIYATVTNWLTD